MYGAEMFARRVLAYDYDAQRKEAPLSGDLFRIRLDVQGQVEPVFRG